MHSWGSLGDTLLSVPFGTSLWTTNLSNLPLTLPQRPPGSAGSTSSLSQCKDVLAFFQLSLHLHGFVKLSQIPLSLPLYKPESQPLSALLKQLLHPLDHLLAWLCHFPYSTTTVLRRRTLDCTWYSVCGCPPSCSQCPAL